MLDNQLIKIIIGILNAGFADLNVTGMANVLVKQANQPTQQGANSAPTVYLTKIGDRRVGSMHRKSFWQKPAPPVTVQPIITTESGLEIETESGQAIAVEPTQQPNPGDQNVTTESGVQITTENGQIITTQQQTMQNVQLQQYETTFQLSALATQDPSDLTGLTASDILNFAAFVMQADDCIAALEAQGIGILRINQIRNPAFSDDRQRFEYVPSFDFTLTHKQIIVKTAPTISSEEFIILPV